MFFVNFVFFSFFLLLVFLLFAFFVDAFNICWAVTSFSSCIAGSNSLYTQKGIAHTHKRIQSKNVCTNTNCTHIHTHTTQLLYNTNDDKRQMIMKSLSVDLLQSSNMNFHKTKFLLLVPSFRFLRCYTSLLLIFFT